jgi:uncharacterized protein
MRVFVTGGTGLVGARLVRSLVLRQHSVTVLTRRPVPARALLNTSCAILPGDPTQPGPWMETAHQSDAVINLAGENLFNQRWNATVKELIRTSRLTSTDLVVQALGRRPPNGTSRPFVLVNASAIGYYGAQGDEALTEDSPPGTDFLAKLCVQWEHAAQRAVELGVRVVRVRTGVVLDKEGGALRQLRPTFQMGMGGPTGSGQQWVSWVHHADLVEILCLALENPAFEGPINATAPHPVRNKEFAHTVAHLLDRPALVSTPRFALRLMLGEAADIVLTGQRVLPAKALALGYSYRFPTLREALADLLK